MSNTSACVLVVDADDEARMSIVEALVLGGIPSAGVSDGARAVLAIEEVPLSAVITELTLPCHDGFELCRRVRASRLNASTPVMIRSARAEEIDRIVAFELGADDFVAKPASDREVVLRTRRLLRAPVSSVPQGDRWSVGVFHVDGSEFRVQAAGANVPLTPTEFRLFASIARRGGAVASRASLVEEVWDRPEGVDDRTLDTHVRKLREKLGRWGREVQTVRGFGYRLAAAL